MIIWRMCIECWTSKATNTHTDYVTLFAFPQNDGYTNAPQCYIIRTFPGFFENKLRKFKFH